MNGPRVVLQTGAVTRARCLRRTVRVKIVRSIRPRPDSELPSGYETASPVGFRASDSAQRSGRSRSHASAACVCPGLGHKKMPTAGCCPSHSAHVPSIAPSNQKTRQCKRLGYLQRSGTHRANSARRVNRAAAIQTSQAPWTRRQDVSGPGLTVWGQLVLQADALCGSPSQK